jgi:transcription elongation factor GreA
MQIPKRRSEQHRKYDDALDPHLSPRAHQDLKNELARLEQHVRPSAVAELTRTREMGDLSENAAYTQAKARVGGLDRRIFEIKEQLRVAVVVDAGPTEDGRARVGATVEVEVRGNRRTYEVTGSAETDPGSGRISHLSPLGSALVGKRAGDVVTVKGANGQDATYHVIEVR